MNSQTKRILLPVDGSEASLKAARYALRIAKLLDADITCIHAIDAPPLLKVKNPALVALYLSQAEKHSKKWIGDVEEMAKKEKAHITSEIIIDVLSVPNTIIDYAAAVILCVLALARNLALYFRFLGFVLSLYPQHGHHNPGQFKNISHI